MSRVAAISEIESGWLCGTGCLLLRASAEALNAVWLSTAYRFHLTQRQVEATAVGSTMLNLNTSVITGLIIAFPKPSEQKEISKILFNQDSVIRSEDDYKEKLLTIKAGLMQDLLTAKVPVTPLLETPSQTVSSLESVSRYTP